MEVGFQPRKESRTWVPQRVSLGVTIHFNPWIGCTKVSPGCEHCYAERDNGRYKWVEGWGPEYQRRKTSDTNWHKVEIWNDAAKRLGVKRKVFCGSLCDVFEDRPELVDWRGQLWSLIVNTPNLNWLLLTKRPENVLRMCPQQIMGDRDEWIPPNVWMGTTVECQAMARKRIPELIKIPARIRFLSVEPMLGPIDLTDVAYSIKESYADGFTLSGLMMNIDWVIVGGESGPKNRPFDVDAAVDLMTCCKDSGVPFFMKQMGGFPDKRDKMSDFHPVLRIREFPV